MFMGLNKKKNHTTINTNTEVQVYFTAKMDTCVCFWIFAPVPAIDFHHHNITNLFSYSPS